uniref:EOG090X0HQJ n=1 Tax=Lynceus sp. MCZ IZ 141354 TaxID=1930659 RepID=A0A9N6ZGA0_9CRUS|nr:EOG090X0HQJ [Lynceus sp. MCZ IZ 141354]
MPLISLRIKASLENVTKLAPTSVDDFQWFLKLKCTSCGEETEKFVAFSVEDEHPLKGGRGSANMVYKCKLCSRENSIDIVKDSLLPYENQDNQFSKLITFDCRGLEPTAFDFSEGWMCEGLETGTKFMDVDLSDDWAEYDEKGKCTVGVYEKGFEFVKQK